MYYSPMFLVFAWNWLKMQQISCESNRIDSLDFLSYRLLLRRNYLVRKFGFGIISVAQIPRVWFFSESVRWILFGHFWLVQEFRCNRASIRWARLHRWCPVIQKNTGARASNRIAQSALNKIRGDIWKAISSQAFVVMEVVKGNFRKRIERMRR